MVDPDDEFVSVAGAGEVYLLRCRIEPQGSFFRRATLGALYRSIAGRSRWHVDVECGSMLWPILLESWPDEPAARARARELTQTVEAEGSLPSHWPAIGRRRRRRA